MFRKHGLTGDGILTALLLIELVARRRLPLAELAAEAMTRLPQVLRNVHVADPSRLASARAVWDEVSLVETELGDNGRVLLAGVGDRGTRSGHGGGADTRAWPARWSIGSSPLCVRELDATGQAEQVVAFRHVRDHRRHRRG